MEVYDIESGSQCYSVNVYDGISVTAVKVFLSQQQQYISDNLNLQRDAIETVEIHIICPSLSEV